MTSAQVVFAVLADAGRPMRAVEVEKAAGLAQRTARFALRSLVKQGLAREQRSLRDTRKTYYWAVTA